MKSFSRLRFRFPKTSCFLSLAVVALGFAGCETASRPAGPAEKSEASGKSANDKFALGNGRIPRGFTRVATDTLYDRQRGFGFETGATLKEGPRGVSSDRPFFFSVRVPEEGNYRVTVTLGDAQMESTTTIKAELR